eukprot:gene20154-23954_t
MFKITATIKSCLLLLLCCIGMSSFAQTAAETPGAAEFKISEVSFKSMGAAISGTLYRPNKIYGALVLVHGSVGQSEGTYVGPEVGTNNIDSANLNLLALDAVGAFSELFKYIPSRTPIGLMGFSQAAWVIPIAAAKNTKIDFMVLFSGPVATTLEQLRFQFYTEGNAKFWDTHSEADAREHIRTDPDKYQFAATDPSKSLMQLSIPGLWLFGGRDVQAPVGLSVENLEMLKAKGKPYEFHIFPAFGHNTAFAKSKEPVNEAIKWIIALKQKGIGLK